MRFFDSQSEVGAESVTTDLSKPPKSNWRYAVHWLLLLILALIVITIIELIHKGQAAQALAL